MGAVQDRTACMVGAALASMWGAPVLADRIADAFATCEPFITIQYEQCEVETHARCPNGDRFMREDNADVGSTIIRTTEDGDILFEVDEEGWGILQVLESRDPASVRALANSGTDSFDMTVEFSHLFTQRSLFQGWYRLNGGGVRIDGRNLLIVDSEQMMEMGAGGQTAVGKGVYYLDDEWGLLLEGPFHVTFAGADMGSIGSAPAAFIFPGESGFASTTPTIGCGPMMSKAPR